jgi:glycogen(starch) synthase
MVSWEFPPLVVGGLGRHVGMLVPELRRLGHDVRVLTHTLPAPALTQDGLLQQARDGSRELIRAAGPLLTGWQPDLLHGHDWLTASAVQALRERLGVPVVTTLHATESGRQQGYLTTPLQQQIHRIEAGMCRSSNAILVCSDYLAQSARQLFGLPESSLTVIGNGASLQAVPTVARDRNLVSFAGRLVHEKGVQELVKALPLLRADYPDIHAVIAGDGPLLTAQQDRAERYHVADRIRWPGYLADSELAALFASSAVVVVPSLYEPFGLVAVEAQRLGTPVAVSDTGGLRELVRPGRTGVRFQPESPAALAAAVRGLLLDPQHAQRMADAGRRQAETRFSWASVAARTEAVYRRLAAA